MKSTDRQENRTLLPVGAWQHSWPTQCGWRHLIFDSHQNGLDSFGAIVRVGTGKKRRRILIDESQFFAWCRAVDAGEVTMKRTNWHAKRVVAEAVASAKG